jgi:uncharacterized membrane protein (DUF485 family)
MSTSRLPEATSPALKSLGGYSASQAAGENGKSDTDNLLCALIAATTDVAKLRVELGDALREVDRWRTVAEQRQTRLEKWDGRDRRGVVKSSELLAPSCTPEWLAQALKPAPRRKHRSRMVATVVVLAVFLVGIIGWPGMTVSILSGLGVGIGIGLGGFVAGWVAWTLGRRKAERERYSRHAVTLVAPPRFAR